MMRCVAAVLTACLGCVLCNACMAYTDRHLGGETPIDDMTALCEEVSCGGHGACVVEPGAEPQLRCLCEPGFVANGTSCETRGPALSDLVAVFATPNAIHWQWDAARLGSSVDGYLVWYGDSLDDVVNRRGRAAVWDVDDDPNLGWGYSPYGPRTVTRTIITGLADSTTYYTRLWARFQNGDSFVVADGMASTTAPPTSTEVIFDETMPKGWRLEFEGTLASTAHSGSGALWFSGNGEWQNARLAGLDQDITTLATGDWQQAYLELFISLELDVGEAYCAHNIHLELCPVNVADECFAFHDPNYLVLPNRPGWHRVQVPLASLLRRSDQAVMTPSSFGTTLDGLQIGFLAGSFRRVYVDDIVIRY